MGVYIFKEFFHLLRISLFDSRCQICENNLVFREEKHICSDCQKSFTINTAPTCEKCGKKIRKDLSRCGECQKNPPDFIRHISYSLYEDTIREFILKIKYSEVETLNKTAVNCYAEAYKKFGSLRFDLIIPVPMDRGRTRTYDHILEISKGLSKRTGIPLDRRNLIKTKKTEPQAGLTMARRLKNLDGAFKVATPEKLKGKTILLIDDVYTTGTTIKKCTAPLMKAGATVYALTLARSV